MVFQWKPLACVKADPQAAGEQMLRFRRHLCEQVLYDLLDAFTANTILQLDQIRNTRCGRIQGPDRILHLAGSLPELGHSLLFAAEQPYHAG